MNNIAIELPLLDGQRPACCGALFWPLRYSLKTDLVPLRTFVPFLTGKAYTGESGRYIIFG